MRKFAGVFAFILVMFVWFGSSSAYASTSSVSNWTVGSTSKASSGPYVLGTSVTSGWIQGWLAAPFTTDSTAKVHVSVTMKVPNGVGFTMALIGATASGGTSEQYGTGSEHQYDLVFYTAVGLSFNELAVQVPGYSFDVSNVGLIGLGDFPPPVAPTNVTVSNVGTGSFIASWVPVAGATSYKVLVDGAVTLNNVIGTSVVLSPFVSGSMHDVSVEAVNSHGTGAESALVYVTLRAFAAPTDLVASVGDAKVTLTWQGTESSYEIYRDGVPYGRVDGGTQANIGGLVNGNTYSFTVASVDNFNNKSTETSAVSVRPQPPPIAINGLAYVSGGTSARLTWGGSMVPFVAVVKDSTGKVVSTFSTTQTANIVTGLTPHATYTVVVTDAGQNSLSGSFYTGTTHMIPPVIPDVTPTLQLFGGLFPDGAKIALFVIIATIALGGTVLVLKYGFGLTKGRLVASQPSSKFSNGDRKLVYGKRMEFRDGKWKYQGKHVKGTKWHKRKGDA